MSEAEGASFQLAQIFLVGASFGYRKDPVTVPPDQKVAPQELRLEVGLRHLNDGEATMVLLHVVTNPENKEEAALYDFDVEIAALVKDVDRAAFPDPLLTQSVASMVYPFLRETVANLTMRGRFGPVWLRPLNVRKLVG